MTRLLPPLLTVLLLMLTACGGGGSGGAASPPATATATTPLTVTPALGKVRNATVRALALDGRVLAQGSVDAQGQLTLQVPVGDQPLVLELVGAAGAEYYDEGMEQWHALPSGVVLHAVRLVDEPAVTLTVLSEIVYRRALFLGSGQLNATVITQSRHDMQAWLASLEMPLAVPADFSLLSPVQVVDGTDSIDASHADGWHAMLLAGISRYAFVKRSMDEPDCLENPDCFPLSGAMDDLLTAVAQDRLASPALMQLGSDLVVSSQVYNLRRLPLVENASVHVMAEIADAFAGGHVLTCEGVADPVQLRVLPSGDVVLKGSMGSIWWGGAALQLANSVVAHEYKVTASGAGFTLDGMHAESGLADGASQVTMVHDSLLMVNADGNVILSHEGTIYACSGMPVRTMAPPAFTRALRAGSYGCSGGASAVVADEQAAVTSVLPQLSLIPLSTFPTYTHYARPQFEAGSWGLLQTFSYQGTVRIYSLDVALTVSGARVDSDAGRVLHGFSASVPGFVNYNCSYSGS